MAETPASAQPAPSTSTQAASLTAPNNPTFRYYRPPSQQHRPELPDSYFDPTAADIRTQQVMLNARTKALQDTPLRTAAMREEDDKRRRSRWPQTTIRVKFADRTLLEKTFPSTDKIRSVYAFVRGSLRDDVKPIKFVLYQSPPKREYKVSDPKVRDLSLAELDLAPSSVLMIKFDHDELDQTDHPAPLDASILAVIEDCPTPPDFDKESTDAIGDKSTGGSKPRSNFFGNSEESKQKLPKWLKLGPK